MHPPDTDFASSDYHLFQFLQNFLNGVNLTSKGLQKSLVLVFCLEIPEVLHQWNNGFTRKMAENHRSKLAQICNKNIYVNINV